MWIEDHLNFKRLHLSLLEKQLITMSQESWNFLDKDLLGLIHLILPKYVAFNILYFKTLKGVMMVLLDMYRKLVMVNKVYLTISSLIFRMMLVASAM